MATDEVKIVQDLIDQSVLLPKEDKSSLKSFVKGLNPEDLAVAKSKLTSEKNFILQAFSHSVEATVTDNPNQELLTDLKAFFSKVPRVLMKAREGDERIAESPEDILKEL